MLIKLNITNKATVLNQNKNEIILDIPKKNDFIVNLLSVEGHTINDFCQNDEISSVDIFQNNGYFYMKQNNEILNKIICCYDFKNKIINKFYYLTNDEESLYFDIKSDFCLEEKPNIISYEEIVELKINSMKELISFCDSHDLFITSKRIVDNGLLLGNNFNFLLNEDLSFSI